jgi:DNA polymerase-3 subunit delta
MTPKELQKQCKSGEISGGYLFFGPEEYMKSRCLELLKKAVVGEGDDPFNHVKISAETPGFTERLAEQVGSLPMFAEKKLVELHSVNYNRLSSADSEELFAILSSLPDYEECVLVLYAVPGEFDEGRLPKAPSPLYKKMEEVVTPVFFEHETPAGVNSWVCRHFSANGVFCPSNVAAEMIDFCSSDMFTLASEIEKLSYFTLSKGEKQVDPADIPRVCCGKSIDGAFAFTDALLAGKSGEAMRLLSDMKMRRERPENILGGVVDTLSGMYTARALAEEGLSREEIAKKTGLHAFRVERFLKATAGKSSARLSKALELCMDTDLKIKSSSIENYTLLDRLVMRLCRV